MAVSAVVVNYNGLDCLAATLAGLKASSRPFVQIIVVDDGSTDGSARMVREQYPEVRLIELERNTANLALVRNTGLRAASSRYVFLTDNDIVLRPGCVEQLLNTLLSTPDAFSVVPRLLDQDDPAVVYQSGNDLHFLAVSTGSCRGERVTDGVTDLPPRRSIGGGIMLLDMQVVEQIGYFDTGFVHGWLDDGELHYRGVLAGHSSLHDPAALALVKVRHHGNRRAHGQYYNRLRVMATGYQLRTLLSLSPVLLVFEIAVLLASFGNGTSRAYLRAWSHFLRTWQDIRATRRRVQALRRLGDVHALRHGAFEIPGLWKLKGPARGLIVVTQRSCDVFWWLAYPLMWLH